jgi:polysaccharide biosynthesis protein PslJ
MAVIERHGDRRTGPAIIVVLGIFAFAVGFAFGPTGVVAGAAALAAGSLLAFREAREPFVTWPNAIALLMLVVWLIPIKAYRLPVNLVFHLEAYRLMIMVLVFAWFLWALSGRGGGGLAGAGHAKALLFLMAVAIASAVINFQEINAAATEPHEALKSLSYFLSFAIVFALVCSTLNTREGLETVVKALVIGGTIVALAALHEARATYNVFDHLHEWLPGFVREQRDVFEERGGRLRVYASAQHPIALGVALLMLVPLALHLATRAASKLRSRLWLFAGLFIAAGSMATVSRTTVVMGVAMVAVALLVRKDLVLRFWPLLLLLPFVVHVVAPGALGGLWKSFFPEQGLVSDLEGRAGQTGSGRFADVGPGFELWKEKPLIGHGLGSKTVEPRAPGEVSAAQPETEIIFDNQYLNALVLLGGLGLIATAWFVWGLVGKLVRFARDNLDENGDLAAACAIACAGFAASMFLFDAFFFVQATIVFFAIGAVGLRAKQLEVQRSA